MDGKLSKAGEAVLEKAILDFTEGVSMNEYEMKREARIERMKERAERAQSASSAAYAGAKAIADRIPLGQPILVGHHSEKRHRWDAVRIHNGFAKSFELAKEAEDLQRRASAAKTSTAVSSDDPEAATKLKAKLESIEIDRARMVAANKAVRSKDPIQGLLVIGLPEQAAKRLLEPDCMGYVGFPPYALRNLTGEAARLRKRIAELEAKATRPIPEPVEGPGVRIEESENRVRIHFEGKPGEDVRSKLKGTGFRWSPTAGTWQRQASPGAWYEAKRIAIPVRTGAEEP